jgi:hypothetical protein
VPQRAARSTQEFRLVPKLVLAFARFFAVIRDSLS